ncbi:extracellular solute-binding protein [bacterium]|nr:extracellular solute-binding protein [bacterium]
MTMTRSSWLLIMTVAAAVVVPVLASAQTELVVWHAYRGREKAAFEQVVADFEASQQGITVKSLAVPYDAYADKISAAVPRGKGPDVFIYAQDRLGGWVEAGRTIEPLDFYVTPDISERFLPATMEAMTYQGNVYGLPMNFKVLTMFYNKAVLQDPPETSTELVKVAGSLTDQSARRFGLAYWYSDFYYHSGLMNAFGGGVFGEGRDATLDRPENVQSLELLLQWLNEDEILPAEPSTSLITELFNSGRAAMVFSGPWFMAEIGEDVDFGLALLPRIDEAGGTRMKPWMTIEGAYIAEPSENKDAAFDFILHLTDTAAATVMALEGRQTPARTAVYDDPRVQEDPILAAFREQVEYAVPMPNFAEMTMVWSPATTAMNSLVRGAASPEVALEQAQEDVEARIASLRK